jgi:hypothetical protein
MEYAPNILRPNPRRFEYKPNKPVTIAIGIIAKTSIIMAADSQTTRGNIKYLDAKKINALKLADAQVLIAQAGNVGNCHPWNNIDVTAMYVIEEVKRMDTYCGGTMSKAVIHVGNEAAIVPPCAGIENEIAFIKQADKNFSAEWARKMEIIITNIVKAVQTGKMN